MDLSVTLKGQTHDLKLKNPVLTASGTFGYGVEFAPYGDLAALGGIVVKGLSLKPREGNPCPRIVETTAGMLNAVGLQNDGWRSSVGTSCPICPGGKRRSSPICTPPPRRNSGNWPRVWTARKAWPRWKSMFPAPTSRRAACSSARIPSWPPPSPPPCARGAPHKHVMVKLSPNVTDIALMARSVEDAGADSVSCINTLLGMAVDLRTRRPSLANVVGGLSGPAIKPVALRCVWQAAQAVKIPVVGMGGIASAEDALEFILVGAAAVQVGTANFMRPDSAFALAAELPAACERLGARSPAELRGALRMD